MIRTANDTGTLFVLVMRGFLLCKHLIHPMELMTYEKHSAGVLFLLNKYKSRDTSRNDKAVTSSKEL